MTPLDLGWITGIIDGEGCLTIRILLHQTKKFGIRPRFQPQLTVANTDEKMMIRFGNILTQENIKYRYFMRRGRGGNRADQFCVEMYAGGLRKLLPLIREVSSKREQIIILQRALEMTEANIGTGHTGYWGRIPMTNEILKEFDDLRSRLTDLHGRQSKKLIKIKADDYKDLQ